MFKLPANVISFSRRYSLAQAKTAIHSSSPLNKVLKYKSGDSILGYTVKQVTEVPELHLVALRLQHENTGADHLHIARDDKNNLFSVGLRTIPENSRGAPHILEHLALCGSERFPCRDAFSKMLNRSLSTFMNAFTGCDWTMYPFSTQNPKDFENLLQVYLDAAFFPTLREKDFQQEGWRLEHEEVGNQKSPIVMKGVVFNEMKGVFSDPNQQYVESLLQNLYPSHAYSHVSGGHPLSIPEMTLDEIKDFHARHYHPSNSRFFTYGSFPIESHLEIISEHVLNKYTKAMMQNHVIPEKRWTEPRDVKIHCAFNPMAAIPEKQTTVSFSYLLNEITDTRESFAMSVIGNLLVDGPNAPFYKSLLEPRIGADFSPFTGYNGQLKQGSFSVGLREILESDVDLVKSTIQSTFDSVVKEGFPKERIDGFLHNMELSMKHQTTKFGLSAVMCVNDLWNHGGNPIEALKVNSHIQWLQEQMKNNPHFLQEKVDQYFRQNRHKLCLIMTPNEAEETRMQESEVKLLQSKLAKLNEEDKIQILNNGIELTKFQNQMEDASCLPTLKISDVERNIDITPLSIENRCGIPIQLCEQPTNGITYFKALCKVPQLPENLQLLLPLFSGIMTKMGAGKLDYKQFDQEAELKTGGMSASVHLSAHPSNEGQFQIGVLLSSHCLQKNVEPMMNLWESVFNGLTLADRDRLSQLVKMSATSVAQSIQHNGHLFAMTRASSGLSECAHLQEKMGGLTQALHLKKLAELTNYDEVINDLKHLANIILNRRSMRCAVNANPEFISSSVSTVEMFLNSINEQTTNAVGSSVQELPFCSVTENFHFILPFAVNYIGKSLLTVPYNHEDYASLKVASQLLSWKFLHKEIREKGGAYGSGAKLDVAGTMRFYSYRDPNVSSTLNCFTDGLRWLMEGSYSHQDIDEAKLSIFGEIDYPISPGGKGSAQFLQGISDEMKQTLRQRLFFLTKEEIISATNRHLLQSSVCGVALIGPKNDISNSKEWTSITG